MESITVKAKSILINLKRGFLEFWNEVREHLELARKQSD